MGFRRGLFRREVVPVELAISRDVDLFAYDAPDVDATSDLLDGALGQASAFDQTFGYYCDGVGPETATLPTNWRERAREFASSNTNGVIAIVPEPNDIALSKLCAWREKDVMWLRVAIKYKIIDPEDMSRRLLEMPVSVDNATLAKRIEELRAAPSQG